MKNISYRFIFTFLFMTIAWTGCDDMLNVSPETDFTDENFWKTEAHLRGACNRLYQDFSPARVDLRGDDQVANTANSISDGSRQRPEQSNDYTTPYRRIFTANNIVKKASSSPVEERIRNRYTGEARFFRAWYYFDLVMKYGDVPLVLDVFSSTTDPGLKMGRTPRETVIQQCYEDLEFAAAWLPTRADMQSVTNEYDRRLLTRSAALALMARIALYEGTMLKFHNLGNEAIWKAHLQKSIDAFNLLKAEGHQLYTEGGTSVAYQGLFIEERNSINREVIFAKAYGPDRSTGSATVSHNFVSEAFSSFGITRAMLDLYLYADGLPRGKSPLALPSETSFNHVFGYESDGVTPIAGGMGARDPRLPLSIWRLGDPQDENNETVAGFRIAYRLSPRGDYAPNPAWNISYTTKKMFIGELHGTNTMDWVVIRWGEMLISYAEALYELTGSISNDQLDETVNTLRARVGFDVKLTNEFVNAHGLDMREEIRRERTVELMIECFRYPDIIRWKIAETVLPKAMAGFKFTVDETINGSQLATDPTFTARLTDATGSIGGIQEYDYPEADIVIYHRAATRRFNPQRDYYYPIPTFEIAQSDGNIVQNPFWD